MTGFMVHPFVMTNTARTEKAEQTDPRPLLASALETSGNVVSGVRADQAHDPTPCSEFDVGRLLDHLVMVVERVGALGRGDSFMAVEEVHRTDGWAGDFASAATACVAAWADDESLERTVVLPWTQLPGAEALRIYLSEISVHAWDLAVATHQRPTWDERVLEESLEAMHGQLPAEGRRQVIEEAIKSMPPGTPVSIPFEDAVEVPSDAPLIDRLVAWTGRKPFA